jgi:uncharacterized protein YceK
MTTNPEIYRLTTMAQRIVLAVLVCLVSGCASFDQEAVGRQVMDALGVYPKMNTKIVVCEDEAEVGRYHEALYGVYVPREGFYSKKNDTVYYVRNRKDVYAHEWGHAVVETHFAPKEVTPFMHEVLAQAVTMKLSGGE